MQRHRTVAAAPARTGSEAWSVIAELIGATLDRSAAIAEADVASALVPLRGLGPALVAAGHLERQPLVLVAGSLHLSIDVVTGAAALAHEENLAPVPGGGSAPADWTLHVPTDHPLGSAVESATALSPRLSADSAPKPEAAKAVAASGPVDSDALRRLQGLS